MVSSVKSGLTPACHLPVPVTTSLVSLAQHTHSAAPPHTRAGSHLTGFRQAQTVVAAAPGQGRGWRPRRPAHIAVVRLTSLKFVPSYTKLSTNFFPLTVPVARVPVTLKFAPKVSVRLVVPLVVTTR